ncbi:sensor histidine kinase [Azospirillum isscasi]|uniref:histidine kinase n=1 Tax=Azospirillum isscasi TaxID=3053926 RepID=A0ABU0WIX5_9PROT|nr:ATP-binding protein [Azospirillum isscasi]MDQ2104042.1 ATP-binding protein [Azospirillum isscasi]
MGCRRRGGTLWIEVYDTGRGIAETDRRRIFEEFVQLDRPDRDRSEGIGLGLAIVDRLARLLGHPLELRSVEGRGTVFAVGVPAVVGSHQPVAA